MKTDPSPYDARLGPCLVEIGEPQTGNDDPLKTGEDTHFATIPPGEATNGEFAAPEPPAGFCEISEAAAAMLFERVSEGLQTSGPTVITGKPAPLAGSANGADDAIERYKLIRKLGDGGFGVVWHAEQIQPLRREVALKVIKPGMDSREIIARFEAERQALALMDHPNIAGVLEAGTTTGGRPYFAMELVNGVAITAYCDTKRLTIRQRLELFIPICHAVQHAHQKAILHRDLKPSNILVTELDGRPVPKVIDFGIAKALGTSREAMLQATLAYTLEGTIIGTPQYMSPEQAGAAPDLDTRSDIYTLGVILYQLLTGSTPLGHEDLRKAPLDEVLRLVREADPVKPSSCVTPVTDAVRQFSEARGTEPSKFTRALRGDLDWITLKALEKERERRYESAAALAQEIERHLNHEPVEAGRPNSWIRLRKLMRRNRLAFGAAAAIVVLLVAGIGVSTWQALRALHAEALANQRLQQVVAEKTRADTEAGIAKAVNEFLRKDILAQAGSRVQANTFSKANPDLTMKVALDRASKIIESRFQAQPLVEAQIQQTLGRTYDDLGEPDSAIPHLRRAMTLQTEHLGPENSATLQSRNDLANALNDQGKYVEAEAEHRAVLAIRLKALGAEDPDTLDTRSDLGLTLEAQGKYAEAEREHRAVLASRQKMLGAEHRNTLASRNDLANALQGQGKYPEAERELRAVLAIQTRMLGAEHPYTLQSRGNLGNSLCGQRKYDEAEREYRNVLEIETRVMGAEHPDTLAARQNLARALQGQEKFAEAEQEYREVLAICRRVLGAEHPRTLMTWSSLAFSLNTQGKHTAAEREFREMLAISQRVLVADHPLVLGVCIGLAWCLEAQGRLDEALGFAKRAETGYKRFLGPEDPDSLMAQKTRKSIEAALMKVKTTNEP